MILVFNSINSLTSFQWGQALHIQELESHQPQRKYSLRVYYILKIKINFIFEENEIMLTKGFLFLSKSNYYLFFLETTPLCTVLLFLKISYYSY